jgi:hypothetical protein
VTCTKDGTDFLVDIGEKTANCQAFISLLPGGATRYEVFKLTGNNDTKFRIRLYNNTTPIHGAFNMIVFKAGNDPLHEYDITIASNMNGVRIGHGFHGIDAYGVDSITINITILANVVIGGPDPDTSAGESGSIVIANIPCPAKITINNHGRIIGRGGRGGSGGGTYLSTSQGTNVNCGIDAGFARPGGNAIETSKKITVNNYGFIAGGGGGGGGGKSLSTTGSNGGGGGTGAGWPLEPGGMGGRSYYAAGPLENCPPGGTTVGCGTSACCCGGYAPFGLNGNGNTRPSANVFNAGLGGAGVNGGFPGVPGGGLALSGASGSNTGPHGSAGKVLHTTSSGFLGSVVNNLNGGSYIGVVF